MRLYDYAFSGHCFKVRLLLSLLDRPYERVPVDIFAGDTLSPEYARLNPVRETPVLETDDGEVLTQSNAILWYLAGGTPYLPDGRVTQARVLQWLSFEQEWVRGIAGVRFRVLTGRDGAEERRPLGQRALEVLDAHLDGRDHVVGDAPTIADVSLFGYVHVAPDAGYDLSALPNVGAWLGRIRALPGYTGDLQPYPANARPGAGRSTYD